MSTQGPVGAPQGEPSKTLCFVANLPWSYDEEAVKAIFSGEIASIKVRRPPIDPTDPAPADQAQLWSERRPLQGLRVCRLCQRGGSAGRHQARRQGDRGPSGALGRVWTSLMGSSCKSRWPSRAPRASPAATRSTSRLPPRVRPRPSPPALRSGRATRLCHTLSTSPRCAAAIAVAINLRSLLTLRLRGCLRGRPSLSMRYAVRFRQPARLA